jgi:hypothetical protein
VCRYDKCRNAECRGKVELTTPRKNLYKIGLDNISKSLGRNYEHQRQFKLLKKQIKRGKQKIKTTMLFYGQRQRQIWQSTRPLVTT